ncbi:hypothetical protein [Desulfuromonas sp.]|uniref:hypothetical protein n=1 Tax=Desulfuromonas sp. TaxID=892 RepID=UPI0025BDDC66|nr:hypothetical protein [Desulfuromonas sp.]
MAREIKPLIDKNEVVILGEKHGKPESTQLFTEVCRNYTKSGKCLTVALEISSNQQTTIDRAMAGDSSISNIKISPIIDHPAYREMLSTLREMKHEGRCLNVIAIDGKAPKVSRDEWMTKVLCQYIDNGKVLCLVGNLHAIKKIRWENGVSDPFLGERLVDYGLNVCTVIQVQAKDEACSLLGPTLKDCKRILSNVAARVNSEPTSLVDYVLKISP